MSLKAELAEAQRFRWAGFDKLLFLVDRSLRNKMAFLYSNDGLVRD